MVVELEPGIKGAGGLEGVGHQRDLEGGHHGGDGGGEGGAGDAVEEGPAEAVHRRRGDLGAARGRGEEALECDRLLWI